MTHRAVPVQDPATRRGGAPVVDASLRMLLRALSPAGKRARLSIVIFHRVHRVADPLFPKEAHASSFDGCLTWIRSWFNVIPLADGVAALARGTLCERALAITFDDGYADNATVAAPILRAHGLNATFFITAGYLDGGRMWNDRVIQAVRTAKGRDLDLSSLGLGVHEIDSINDRRAACDAVIKELKYRSSTERDTLARAVAERSGSPPEIDVMMSSAQVRELAAAGMGIGAHTMTHAILAREDDGAAVREIAQSRDVLEGIVRQPVTLFAYPNGKPGVDYRAEHVATVRSLGFAAAVSTSPGAARGGETLHELPRFTPWDASPARFGFRFARNMTAPIERASA